MQLQERVGDPQHPLQHRRALVLDKHEDPMRASLAQLLHNLRKVDRGEEVPPAVLCDLLDLFFVPLAVWQSDSAGDDLAWWSGTWLIFRPRELRVLGEVKEAVAEEAVVRE